MFTGISLGVVVAIIAVIALLGIIASGYVKAPPDTAFIISGLRKKIIIGKSSIKIPFLERLDKLSLKLIPIDVKMCIRDRGQVRRKQLGIRAFYRDIGRKVVVIRPVAVGGMVLHRHVE